MIQTQNLWAPRINDIAHELLNAPGDFISATALEILLQIPARQAQKILKPLITKKEGRIGLAPKIAVIQRLRELAGGDWEAEQELDRRRRLGRWLLREEAELKHTPRLLIEAPVSIVNTRVDELAGYGVELGPGRLTMQFETVDKCLLAMLAVAKAASLDYDGFAERVRPLAY